MMQLVVLGCKAQCWKFDFFGSVTVYKALPLPMGRFLYAGLTKVDEDRGGVLTLAWGYSIAVSRFLRWTSLSTFRSFSKA